MRRPSSPGIDLTERERDVLRLVAEGRTNAEIADRLGIRFDTAKNHVHSILQKLGVGTREEAATWWRAHGREVAAARRERGRWMRLGVPDGLWRVAAAVGGVAAVVVLSVVGAVVVAGLNQDAEETPLDPDPTEVPATATAAPPTPAPTPPAADTPTPAPTPPTLVNGIPEGAVGPLLIFWQQTGHADRVGGRFPIREIVAYDAGRGEQASLFPVGWLNRYAAGAAVAGTEVLVNFQHSVVAFQLDARERVVYTAPEGGGVGDIAVSPDQTLLAIAEGSELTVIDIASGAEVFSLARDDHAAFDDFVGFFWQVQWRDDGQGVVIKGGTQSERPGGIATVLLDGTVRVHPYVEFGWVAPSGRAMAFSGTQYGCMAIAGTSVTVVDLDSETVIAAVQDDTQAMRPLEWSPDGRYLVISSVPVPPGGPPTPPATGSGTECDWLLADPSLLLLDMQTAAVEPTERTLIELRRDWSGQPGIAFACGEAREPGYVFRMGPEVYSGPCYSADGSEQLDVRVLYDGEEIGAGAEVTLLGTVEVP